MRIAWLAVALLLSGTQLTVEVGQKKTVKVGFPPAGGDNTNPGAMKVLVDADHQRITFQGKAPGRAVYTVIDARDPSHIMKYEVKVVEPPPPPPPPPSPSPSPSPSTTPPPTPAATAPGAGSKT